MPFTEFYTDFSAGSNLNAGSSTAGSAAFTYTSDLVSGWNSGTGVFTVASGTPNSDMASMADGTHWASVYVTIGATIAVFVGRITAVSATTITVSLTAKSGTPPATDLLGATTLKVDGAWKGPNAAVGFPFGFVQNTMTNASGHYPRANFKGGTSYAITAAMTHANNGPVRFEGYTTTPGDGGMATIDGGTTGASYLLLTLSGANIDLANFIAQNNGATGNAGGITVTTSGDVLLYRVVANSIRGIGIYSSILGVHFVECEAYGCVQANTIGHAGIRLDGATNQVIRCISHDNVGSNAIGFYFNLACVAIECIADTNGNDGFQSNSSTSSSLIRCNAYNNGGDGIDFISTSACLLQVENCNLVKNGGWGINSSGSATLRNGVILNCGFGSGTQVNTSGTINTIGAVNISGTVNYASNVTPWVDPANGDFRINLATAKGTGRGSFTQTAASYAGTIGYPDIGAAQHLEAASGGGASPIGLGSPVIRAL